MVTKKKSIVVIPGDVPGYMHKLYVAHMKAMCRDTGRLFMFAADQKIEHLNDDFYGAGITSEANDPEHIFRIARDGSVGALAVPGGMFARYGTMYKTIHYIVKLNGKTNCQDTAHIDPMSAQMWDIEELIYNAAQSGIHLCGVGFTIYIGSEYEAAMMAQAARMVTQAHQEGLVAILWIYPRARHMKDITSPALIQGAAGLGNALGADFVKVNMPCDKAGMPTMPALKVATQAAGNTGVIISGGKLEPAEILLKNMYQTLDKGGASGAAVGRNIFQRPHDEAVALCKAVAALIYDRVSYQEAFKIFEKNK